MNAPLTCRPATLAEADCLTDFQIALAAETEQLRLDPAICGAGVRAVFERPERGHYVVAEQAGRVLGALLVTSEWSDWRNGEVWWLQSVYVLPGARGQGVFKALYTHVLSRVQADPRIHGLRLYVDRRNARARQVYVQLGMTADHYEVCEWMK